MSLPGQFDNQKGESKKADWLERLDHFAQLVMALAAVFALVQDRIGWSVLFGIALLSIYFPFLSHIRKSYSLMKQQKHALAQFRNDFLSFINRAQDFVQSTTQYGIPYYLRNIVTRPGMEVRRFNPNVESFFSLVLRNLAGRTNTNLASYADFERVSQEFFDAMDSFVLIFADDIIRELKRPNNLILLQPQEITGLKQRYASLTGFINEYNGFRSRVAVFWGEKEHMSQIRIPTESFD
jgi:hypothetical protein